jgi:V/A-type H+-transporting ATPase subunit I
MVTLSGPLDMVDDAIRYFIINRDVHMENAITAMKNIRRLAPLDTSNDYAEPLSEISALADELGIEPEFCDFSGENYSLDEVREWISALRGRIDSIKQELEEKSADLDNKNKALEQLLHISGVDENLRDLLNMKYSKFRFGRIPAANYDALMTLVKARDDVFFIRTGNDEENGGGVYGVYFVLPRSVEQVDSIFDAQHFERIRLDKSLTGTADDTKQTLANAIEQDKSRITALNEELREMTSSEKDQLLRRYCYLRFMSECRSLRTLAGYHNDTFYIVAWMPKENEETFISELENIAGAPCVIAEGEKVPANAHTLVVWAASGNQPAVIQEKDSANAFSCVLSDGKETGTKPPVKLKSGFLSKIYAPFVEMYGLPSYGEIDPRFFMALTYTVLFGIMYGDVGQGLVLSLLGIVLWKTKKMWLGRILGLCGISSFVFGWVYGSVFGYEDILPGYKVLEGENTMRILIIAVAIGVVLLLICMITNIINGIRQRDLGKTLFSPNGVAGFIMYFSIAAGVVVLYVFGKNIFSLPYILCLIVLPILCIFAQVPLTKLCTGVRPWLPESIGMFFVEGFFELFETMLSYVSNTISFLRVGAFAISHAGMMMVVMLLASDGKNIIAVIIGNIVVMGIEGMLVCIQVLRLEFYEMFGRFYTGGGEKFTPHIIDYTKKA